MDFPPVGWSLLDISCVTKSAILVFNSPFEFEQNQSYQLIQLKQLSDYAYAVNSFALCQKALV